MGVHCTHYSLFAGSISDEPPNILCYWNVISVELLTLTNVADVKITSDNVVLTSNKYFQFILSKLFRSIM
jgi:hypothetical protein